MRVLYEKPTYQDLERIVNTAALCDCDTRQIPFEVSIRQCSSSAIFAVCRMRFANQTGTAHTRYHETYILCAGLTGAGDMRHIVHARQCGKLAGSREKRSATLQDRIRK